MYKQNGFFKKFNKFFFTYNVSLVALALPEQDALDLPAHDALDLPAHDALDLPAQEVAFAVFLPAQQALLAFLPWQEALASVASVFSTVYSTLASFSVLASVLCAFENAIKNTPKAIVKINFFICIVLIIKIFDKNKLYTNTRCNIKC